MIEESNKPIWYSIKEDQCPICEHYLVLQEVLQYSMKLYHIDIPTYMSESLKCIHCGADFTNQLMYDYDKLRYVYVSNKEEKSKLEY